MLRGFRSLAASAFAVMATLALTLDGVGAQTPPPATPPPTQSVLEDLVSSLLPGDQIELLIKRGSEELTKSAVLGNHAQIFDMEDDRAAFQNSLGGQLSERRYGFPSVIQHDSVLKPEECGGPIVDLDGKAVGINIARAGRVESYALPASLVREAVKKMLETHQTSTSVER